jgi:GT2 family glycosyltransferase
MIQNPMNRGFGVACNQGAKGSHADYLLFLNPDVVLLRNSLSIPVCFMEDPTNDRVGICGIQLVDPEGRVAQSCARFPTLGMFLLKMLGLEAISVSFFLKLVDHLESKVVDHVMGAFFLVRREVYEELKGFDERFFVYFEDLDFSYRAYQAGRLSWFLANNQAQHVGGGCSNQVKAARLFYSLCSRIQYGFKHFGPLRGAVLLLATTLIEPISRLALAASHGCPKEARDTLRSYAMFWRELPSLIMDRRRASDAGSPFYSAAAERR